MLAAVALGLSLAPLEEAKAVTDGNFELTVKDSRETRDGYVPMYRNEGYQICFGYIHPDPPRLPDGRTARADVELTIDGRAQGTYRLNHRENYCVERGLDDPGVFTFFPTTSNEAAVVGITTTDADVRGVISAKFTLEGAAGYGRPGSTRVVRPRRQAPLAYALSQREEPATDRRGPQAMMAAPPGPNATMAAPQARTRILEDPTYDGNVVARSGGTGVIGVSSQILDPVSPIGVDPRTSVTLELRLVILEPTPQPQPPTYPQPQPEPYPQPQPYPQPEPQPQPQPQPYPQPQPQPYPQPYPQPQPQPQPQPYPQQYPNPYPQQPVYPQPDPGYAPVPGLRPLGVAPPPVR